MHVDDDDDDEKEVKEVSILKKIYKFHACAIIIF